MTCSVGEALGLPFADAISPHSSRFVTAITHQLTPAPAQANTEIVSPARRVPRSRGALVGGARCLARRRVAFVSPDNPALLVGLAIAELRWPQDDHPCGWC